MNIDFTNKTIVVTGGTRGIGGAIVKLFKSYNAEIIATGTNIDDLNKKQNKSRGGKINYVPLDYTSKKSVESFTDYINGKKSIDVLINNAGVNKIGSIEEIEKEHWDFINNVNLRGPFLLTKVISDKMKKQERGRIINISSVFGVVSKSKRASYSATKWGLIGLTKAVALDLAPFNILVNAVSPGFIDTDLTRKILGDKGMEKIKEEIPKLRFGKVEEIAKVVLFLASDHNTYITGQNIIVDGGFTSV